MSKYRKCPACGGTGESAVGYGPESWQHHECGRCDGEGKLYTFPTYEDIQRKKQRQQNIAIGAYIAVVMALIAAVTFFLGGL